MGGELENATRNTRTPIRQINSNLQIIRKQSQLISIQQKNPQVANMLLKEYTQYDIQQAIKPIKNKARGTDGIPEEAYKAVNSWVTEPLTIMLNRIKMDNKYPKRGKMEQ